MRDGRRQRLGLATGTEDPATSNDGYLDRILSDTEATGQSNILNLAQDANVNVRDQRYLNDAYQYYLGGGTGEVPTTTVAPDFTGGELIDTSGEGQDIATSGLGLGDTTITNGTNLNDYDQGDMSLADVINNDANVGFATDPVDTYTSPTANVAPDGTTMAGVEGYLDGINLDSPDAGTVTLGSGNNALGLTDPQSLAIGPSGAVDFDTGGLDDIGQAVGEEFDDTPVSTPSGNNPFGYEDLNPSALAGLGINETSGLDDIGADIGVDNTVDYGMPQGSPGQLNPAAPSIDDITTDFSKPNIGEISGPTTMTVDELAASSADQGLDAFDPSAVSQAFTAGKQAIAEGISTVAEVGQSIANTIGGIYNGVDQTVSVFGREINIPSTLAGIALGQVVGAPISLAFGALKAIGGMLPAGGRSDLSDALGGEYGMDDIGRLTSGPMAGYSVDSAFGDISQAARDRAATIEDTISRLGYTEERQAKIDELNAFADKADGIEGDINQDATPADIDAESYSGDASVAEDAEAGGRQGALDARDDLAGVETGDAGVAEAEAAADRQEAATAASNAASVSMGADRYGDGGPGGTTGGTTGADEDFSDFDVGDTSKADPGGTGDFGGTTDSAENSQGGGYSCFIAGTKVNMSDGTFKNIEKIIVGDKVKGYKNDNEIIKLDPTLLANRKLYSFNNSNHYFFTSEHPFMTEEGWKSVKPEKTKERDGIELYNQLEGELKIGDKLVTDKGLVEITDIKSKEINKPDMPLYNFNVSNDNSYIADGYVVHNKGGGSSKIVCTMMNDSYGFGSFRNKIWLKHSKNMKPEYQKGYHKIFLPLVKLSKTNKVLKKILEHIAVHRTIDIRQEARGKTHLLGRVYRKILEPICYIIGKYAK